MGRKIFIPLIGLRNSGKTQTLVQFFEINGETLKSAKLFNLKNIKIYSEKTSRHERTKKQEAAIYSKKTSEHERFKETAIDKLKLIIDKWVSEKFEEEFILLLPFSAIVLEGKVWAQGIIEPIEYAKKKGFEVNPILINTSKETIRARLDLPVGRTLSEQIIEFNNLKQVIEKQFETTKTIDGNLEKDLRGKKLTDIIFKI